MERRRGNFCEELHAKCKTRCWLEANSKTGAEASVVSNDESVFKSSYLSLLYYRDHSATSQVVGNNGWHSDTLQSDGNKERLFKRIEVTGC